MTHLELAERLSMLANCEGGGPVADALEEAALAIQSRDDRIAVLEGERDALAETLKGVASRAHSALAKLTPQEPK